MTLNEVMPIVAQLSRKYTGNDSTSVSYETAQQLMEAALFCIQAGEERARRTGEIAHGREDARSLYEAGVESIQQQAILCRMKYERILQGFRSYGVRALEENIRVQIPHFLTHYDILFRPQEHGISLDYPTLVPIDAMHGAGAVSAFLTGIALEKRFLRAFPEAYVLEALKFFSEGYEELPINVCSVVLRNIMAHAIVQKGLSRAEITPTDFEALERHFAADSLEQVAEKLAFFLRQSVKQVSGQDEDLTGYLMQDVPKSARELRQAIKSRHIESFFQEAAPDADAELQAENQNYSALGRGFAPSV